MRGALAFAGLFALTWYATGSSWGSVAALMLGL